MTKKFRIGNHEPKEIVGGALGSKKGKTHRSEATIREKEKADKLGGKTRPNSGAFAGYKGDIILDHFLLDDKKTAGEVLPMSRKDIVKISREAAAERRIPGIAATFENVPSTVEQDWIMIPQTAFVQMLKNGQTDGLEL